MLHPRTEPRRVSARRIPAVAAGVGMLTGMFGAGGGFVIAPALLLAGGLAVDEAIGTALLAIVLGTAAGVAGQASHASVELALAAGITPVAIAGSLVGARLERRLSRDHLRRAFAWFVIAIGAVVIVHTLLRR
jgi:uncharacterized membrane protein YfcA